MLGLCANSAVWRSWTFPKTPPRITKPGRERSCRLFGPSPSTGLAWRVDLQDDALLLLDHCIYWTIAHVEVCRAGSFVKHLLTPTVASLFKFNYISCPIAQADDVWACQLFQSSLHQKFCQLLEKGNVYFKTCISDHHGAFDEWTMCSLRNPQRLPCWTFSKACLDESVIGLSLGICIAAKCRNQARQAEMWRMYISRFACFLGNSLTAYLEDVAALKLTFSRIALSQLGYTPAAHPDGSWMNADYEAQCCLHHPGHVSS